VVVRVLLIGSGGREHALARALAADPSVDALIAAPGNPGMASVAELRSIVITDPSAVAALAVEVEADLVVVGPEAPLVAGVADAVRGKGIACFGPSGAAAQLEGSKAFAKDVMAAAGVPTARAYVCRTEDEARAALDEFGPPYVVKDDGLASGKGVVVTDDREAALEHARACATVVIEEYLDGPEVSVFVITDGVTAVPLLPAQDFKRVSDGDTGPNTGGMGAYAPLPWAPADLVDEVMATIARPTLREMTQRGVPFSGMLYIGLALTSRGTRVVEFNARFGDPETEAVLALLETPLAGLLHAAAVGRLANHGALQWRSGAAVAVVVANQGYPGPARTGGLIAGADRDGILHCGTGWDADGRVIATGGRVVCAVGTGADLARARASAYRLVDGITLDGAHYRRDIALAAST
jgi:phosphoribosylamine--glycine ligase